MHLGSPHYLCSRYSWKKSESSFIMQSPLRHWSMHQLFSCRECTPPFFTCILLYLSIFKLFTYSYSWLFIFITDQNHSMPYERQGVQSMCNHEFLQRVFAILAASANVFFCNSDPFHNFQFSPNHNFRSSGFKGLLSHRQLCVASLLIIDLK